MTVTTIDWDGLTHARRALIGNPYESSDEDLRVGQEWFAQHRARLPAAMVNLCDTDHRKDARKVALAAMHAAVRNGEWSETGPLRDGVVACVDKGLRLSWADLSRLGNAVSRFHEAAARILGESPAMQALRRTVWTLCFGANLYETLDNEPNLRRLNVLVLGETGTGKELVAEAIQAAALSPGDPPDLSLNCAALPELIAESELFGYERGAHSTATQRRVGKLVASDKGVLFLDEVADLPASVQVKLLSVIQNGRVTPLGSNTAEEVSVRYVAATSRPIESNVTKGDFRLDLHQRLAGYVVRIPPLRERREDIGVIGRHLLGKPEQEEVTGAQMRDVSSNILSMAKRPDDTLRWLDLLARTHDFPGNVRELQRLVRQRQLGLAGSDETLPSAEQHAAPLSEIETRMRDCLASEAEVVSWYMRKVWQHYDGNLAKVDEILKVDRTTLRRRGLKGNPSSSTRKGRQPSK